MLLPVHLANPDIHFWADASGSWGCGVHWNGLWFQVRWGSRSINDESIAAKKLFPVLTSCVVWGSLWKGCTVCCHSDNIAVVSITNQQTVKNGLLSHLLRCLFFAMAIFNFDLVARHVPGAKNGAADALSCNWLDLFFTQMNNVFTSSTPLSPLLLSGRHPNGWPGSILL